jgi:hypothetical protein
MKPEYVSLISGFLGAVLGALVSLASVWLQQRAQERRDRVKLALDAAIKEYESAEKYAEFMAKNGQRIVTRDLGYYVVLHSRLWEQLAAGKPISKEQWVAAHQQAIEINEATVEFYKSRREEQMGSDSI